MALHLAVAVVVLLSVDAGTGTQNTPASSAAPQLLDPITRGVRAGRKGGGAGSASATGDLPLLRAATDGSGDLLHDAPGFSARIAPNGNVSFSDKRLTVLSWLP
ncbi:MAG: hypothetical protein H7X95_09850, partial [Deltaproteobacteria bacterium]|nr:hypothetical protein [Deltaproteobacteria bacterium]